MERTREELGDYLAEKLDAYTDLVTDLRGEVPLATLDRATDLLFDCMVAIRGWVIGGARPSGIFDGAGKVKGLIALVRDDKKAKGTGKKVELLTKAVEQIVLGLEVSFPRPLQVSMGVKADRPKGPVSVVCPRCSAEAGHRCWASAPGGALLEGWHPERVTAAGVKDLLGDEALQKVTIGREPIIESQSIKDVKAMDIEPGNDARRSPDVWIADWSHKHGHDFQLFDHEPERAEIVAGWKDETEPDGADDWSEENIEVRGPFSIQFGNPSEDSFLTNAFSRKFTAEEQGHAQSYVEVLCSAANGMLSALAAAGLSTMPGDPMADVRDAAEALRAAVTQPILFPLDRPIRTSWDSQPELQNLPIPLGPEQLRQVREVRSSLNYMVQSMGIQPVHEERLMELDFADLEVRVLALALNGLKSKFDKTWATELRSISKALFHIAPATSGMDQGHCDMLGEVAAFLEKVQSAFEKRT